MTPSFEQQSLWEEAPISPGTDDSTEPAARLEAAWERRILQGLVAEWESAVCLLPDDLRQSIKPPLFALDNADRRLGAWRPQRREISLSRRLVKDARWDEIREVLLHETAHQVAHELLQARNEPDHGPRFCQACDWLRANPAASGTHRPLHQRLRNGEHADANDRIVSRIQKLMALAKSSNPNEAHAAMRKAHALIARYNVDLIERGARQEYVSIFVGEPRLRHFREAYHLANLLQDFYFVQGMWVPAWVLAKERMGRVLEISGSRKNVLIAEHVHTAVVRYIDTAWQMYRTERKLNHHRKTDFAIGIIHGFRSTLEQATLPDHLEGLLPARSDDPALVRYMAQRYPHVRTFSKSGTVKDARVLADGTEQGRNLVIAKGIEHDDGFQNRLLEDGGPKPKA